MNILLTKHSEGRPKTISFRVCFLIESFKYCEEDNILFSFVYFSKENVIPSLLKNLEKICKNNF